MAFKTVKKSPRSPGAKRIEYAMRVSLYHDKKNDHYALTMVIAEPCLKFLQWSVGNWIEVLTDFDDLKAPKIMLVPSEDSKAGWRLCKRAKNSKHAVLQVSVRDAVVVNWLQRFAPIELSSQQIEIDNSGAVLLDLPGRQGRRS